MGIWFAVRPLVPDSLEMGLATLVESPISLVVLVVVAYMRITPADSAVVLALQTATGWVAVAAVGLVAMAYMHLDIRLLPAAVVVHLLQHLQQINQLCNRHIHRLVLSIFNFSPQRLSLLKFPLQRQRFHNQCRTR